MPKKNDYKSTDVPNGYMISSFGGKNLLFDYKRGGKTVRGYHDIGFVGNFEGVHESGIIYPNIILLVHTVKGEKDFLFKILRTLRFDGNDVFGNLMEVIAGGELPYFAETVWLQYMNDLKYGNTEPVDEDLIDEEKWRGILDE